ncbi:ABC transporter substrate-binding protein [Prosthecobacter sp.]|uniref:ABC transporter substrate-binding protein n=1 Tax=Prosthecobacter sp. TaxID=1965333 RepID=UPI003783C3A3
MNRTVQIRLLPLIVLGTLLCLAGLLWPESGYQRPLSIAVNIWPGAEGLVMACDEGNTSEQRINTVEMSWPTAVMGAFRKRVVDAAVVTLDEMIRLEADGAKPRAILVLGISRGGDAVVGHAGLESMRSLRGKNVGVELKSAGEYLLWEALRGQGMSFNDVHVVPLNLAESEDAYDEKDLDAVVTSDPWCLRLKEKGAAVLHDSSGMDLKLSRVLVVREEALKTYERELRFLVSACLAHNAELKLPENAGRDAALRREGFDQGQWRRSLTRVHLPDAAENLRLMRPGKGGLVECVNDMIQNMLLDGLLYREIKARGLFVPKFLEGAP